MLFYTTHNWKKKIPQFACQFFVSECISIDIIVMFGVYQEKDYYYCEHYYYFSSKKFKQLLLKSKVGAAVINSNFFLDEKKAKRNSCRQ